MAKKTAKSPDELRSEVVQVRLKPAEMARLDAFRAAVPGYRGVVDRVSRGEAVRLLLLSALPEPAAPLTPVVPLHPRPKCERGANCSLAPGHLGVCADIG